MQYLTRSFGVATFAALVGACSSADGTTASDAGSSSTCSAATSFPAAAITTITGDKGTVRVAVRSATNESLVAGVQCVELVVTDASTGASLEGLSVTLTPWMPAMDHGASITPALAASASGHYVFSNVSLPMPGEWELRMQFSGEVSDSVEPTFSVVD